jgi:hypothetical protein
MTLSQLQLASGALPQAAPPGFDGSAEPEPTRNLMVNYLPATLDEAQVKQMFEAYGPVESVKIVIDRETQASKGFGFVKFQRASAAVQAIQCLNGFTILNKRLRVAYANHQVAGAGYGQGGQRGYVKGGQPRYGGYGGGRGGSYNGGVPPPPFAASGAAFGGPASMAMFDQGGQSDAQMQYMAAMQAMLAAQGQGQPGQDMQHVPHQF